MPIIYIDYHYNDIEKHSIDLGKFMDGVKQQVRARQSEALENKHLFEVRKIKRDMRSQIDDLKTTSEATISRIKKDYDKKALDEQNRLEVQLINIRKKNNNMIKDENDRFTRMIEEIKANHETKLSEMEVSHGKEIEKRETEHTEYLENARQKFEAEKARLEA